jgi:hypothetical protein
MSPGGRGAPRTCYPGFMSTPDLPTLRIDERARLVEGWHRAGSAELIPDFDLFRLRARTVEMVPDGDWQTSPTIERGARRFAQALQDRGARVRVVILPITLDGAA